MATLRRFTYMNVSATGVYQDSSVDGDALQLAKVTIVNDGSGVGLDLGTTDIQNGRDAAFRKLTLATGVSGVTIDAGGQRIANVGTPTQGTDAVNKTYVDNLQQGVDWKSACRAASTGNVNIASPGAAIDGVTLVANDRVLLKDQTTGSENGIWIWNGATSAMTRAADATTGYIDSGTAVFVTQGTANADSGWIVTTDGAITVGTTAIAWTQFTALGQVNAGAGITKTGNTMNIGANADGSIVVNADDIQVGVLATDAQHGNRGGGGLHAVAVAGGANGFMSGADKQKLDGIASGATANTGTVTSVGLSLPAEFNITTASVSTSGTLTAAWNTQTQNKVFASPNGATGAPSFRALVAADIPTLNQSTTGQAGSVANALTLKADGTGDAALSTYNGSAAKAISYNSIGAAPLASPTFTGTPAAPTAAADTNSTQLATTAFVLGQAAASASPMNGTAAVGTSTRYARQDHVHASDTSRVPTTRTLTGTNCTIGGAASGDLSADRTIAVTGVPSLFTINGSAVSANVTAANLGTLTGGGDASALHTHSGLAANALAFNMTAGAAVTKGDPLYVDATGKVQKGAPGVDASSVIVGVAQNTAALNASCTVQRGGVLAGAGAGWTIGNPVFLGSSASLTQDPVAGITSRHRTIMVGVAVTATDLLIDVRDFGKKP